MAGSLGFAKVWEQPGKVGFGCSPLGVLWSSFPDSSHF